VNINEANFFVICKLSAPVKQGSVKSKGGVKYIPTVFSNTTQSDITTEYQRLYGIVPASGTFIEFEHQIFMTNDVNWLPKYKEIAEVG
jgi:hypothetical protein